MSSNSELRTAWLNQLSANHEASEQLYSRNRELHAAKRSIDDALIRTYPHREIECDDSKLICVISYSAENALLRIDLIEELDEINQLLAPIRARRRELKIEADYIRRQIDLIDRAPKKSDKQQPRQGSLFT